jgi:DNA-binding FadR family transcriptional regulator
VKVYQLVQRRHGKVYELVDIAPPLEGLAMAFARAALGRALDDLHQARSALTRAATRLQAERARAWITAELARVADLKARLAAAPAGASP